MSESDPALELIVLRQIDNALQTIQRRFTPISSPDDFSLSDANMEKLDALCMQLSAIGESIKNLDKITNHTLLAKYPQVEWKRAMGMRDIISYHYFDMDAEIVFSVCKEHVPKMQAVIQQMLADLSKS